MRIWLTRTRPGAEATARRLRAMGHRVIVDPVLAVEPLRPAIDLKRVAALAFTSANGVAAFAEGQARRDLPVFAVGPATARAARRAGFTVAGVGEAGAEALVPLIARAPPGGTVLIPGAEAPAGDPVSALAVEGIEARALAVYRTVERRPRRALAALADGVLDVVWIQSARAATILATILPSGTGPTCICASPAAASTLAGRCPVLIAPSPDEAALIEATSASTTLASARP